MATQDNPPNKIAELPLTAFELPKWLVEPAVRSCRLFNTALDFVFYDVPTLRAALAEKDAPMQARGEKPPSRIIDFDALSDPEGSLLLIDATTAPYVHKYQSVEKFLQSPYQETRDVDIATITGVGSSALGSAALAWDISVALEKPVLAIVPGYGVADVVLQGLGGWFAFGLHDFLSSKTLIQTGLATAAPETACIGRELAASTPQEPTARGGAPIFRYGSGSSDVLHALLEHRVTPFLYRERRLEFFFWTPGAMNGSTKVQSSQANSGCMLSGARRVHPVIVGWSTANRPLLPKPINDNP
jgi:hypothetical protein